MTIDKTEYGWYLIKSNRLISLQVWKLVNKIDSLRKKYKINIKLPLEVVEIQNDLKTTM